MKSDDKMVKAKLPEGWSTLSVAEIGKTSTGNTPPTKNKENYGSYLPYIKPPHLINRSIGNSDTFLSESGAAIARVLPPLSTLVTCIGNLGRTAINKTEVAFNQQINAISPHEGIDPHFIFYQAQSPNFRNQLESRASATTISIVNKSSFNTINLNIAPLNEQKRIVAKIEELFSEIDAGEQSLRDARKQLTLYRQSLLKQAFEGKLTETWRVNNPDKLESQEKLLARIGVEGTKAIAPHSCNSWLNVPLGNLCEYITSGSRGWAKYYADQGSLFIRAQNLKTDSLRFDDTAYVALPEKAEGTRTLTKVNDLLVTITGANVTKTAYVNRDLGEAYVSQHVALCRLREPNLTPFLYLYLVSPSGGRRDLEKSAYGAGKPGLNLANIRTLNVPLCSQAEQQEIVNILDEQFTAVEQNEKEIDHSLKRSQALRQSILKKAFEGKLSH